MPSVFSNLEGITAAISLFLSVFIRINTPSEFLKVSQAYFWISLRLPFSSWSFFISKTVPVKFVCSPKFFCISYLLLLYFNSSNNLEEFTTDNETLTQKLCDAIKKTNRKYVILLFEFCFFPW